MEKRKVELNYDNNDGKIMDKDTYTFVLPDGKELNIKKNTKKTSKNDK